jgi:hypothetical protein
MGRHLDVGAAEGLQAIPDPSDKVGPGWTHKHGAFAPPPSVPRPPK